MKDFKKWWNEQDNLFCGEGGMEVAEEAWNAAMDILSANEWLADLRSEEESLMTYSPLNKENHEFDEPMANLTITAPQRILEPMFEDITILKR